MYENTVFIERTIFPAVSALLPAARAIEAFGGQTGSLLLGAVSDLVVVIMAMDLFPLFQVL